MMQREFFGGCREIGPETVVDGIERLHRQVPVVVGHRSCIPAARIIETRREGQAVEISINYTLPVVVEDLTTIEQSMFNCEVKQGGIAVSSATGWSRQVASTLLVHEYLHHRMIDAHIAQIPALMKQ